MMISPEQVYDCLIKEHRIVDPVVLRWNGGYVIGRWEAVGLIVEETQKILRGPRVAVVVLGQGSTLDEAFRFATARLLAYEDGSEPARSTGATNGALRQTIPRGGERAP